MESLEENAPFGTDQDEDDLGPAAAEYLRRQLDLPLEMSDGTPIAFYRPDALIEAAVDARQFHAQVLAVAIQRTETGKPPKTPRAWMTISTSELRLTTEWKGLCCEVGIPLRSSRRFPSAGHEITLELDFPPLVRLVNAFGGTKGTLDPNVRIRKRPYKELFRFGFYAETKHLEIGVGEKTQVYLSNVDALLSPRPPIPRAPADMHPNLDAQALRVGIHQTMIAADKPTSTSKSRLISIHETSVVAVRVVLAARCQSPAVSKDRFSIDKKTAEVLAPILRRFRGARLQLPAEGAVLDDGILRCSFPYEASTSPHEASFDEALHDATAACRLEHTELLTAMALLDATTVGAPLTSAKPGTKLFYALIGDTARMNADSQLAWELDFLNESQLIWLRQFEGPVLLLASRSAGGTVLSTLPLWETGEKPLPTGIMVGSLSLAELKKVVLVLKSPVSDFFFGAKHLAIRSQHGSHLTIFVLNSKLIIDPFGGKP